MSKLRYDTVGSFNFNLYFRVARVPCMKNYYLKFLFRGKENPFICIVEKQTANRIQECLLNRDRVTDGGFIEIEQASKKENVYVKISQIQMCQVLWDNGIVESNDEDEDLCNDDALESNGKENEEGYSLLLILSGVNQIFRYSDMKPDNLQEIIDSVTDITNEISEEFFIRLIDDDGEVNLVKANDIILMECLNPAVYENDFNFELN
ncbi:hypothetical protein DSM106972_048460 [Dulcicalothrix desertica PCC 7102]|uniref:Uncharacterized protein n=2 Tax=Dulcicalothrix desertica TaxID=32056 RepID=A0A433VCT5_9CYAN|nr:hypothetical protein DSM106972_048460 [Dulcicalothrix desertica PCC 7102]